MIRMSDRAIHYELTRFILQRSLAFIYFFAFLIVVNQYLGLCGSKGLLPVQLFVKRVSFTDSPSLFFFWNSDLALQVMAWLGLGLSFFALSGMSDSFSNWVSIGIWFTLWIVYLSFVNVGQTFYGFGWEILLPEVGFLAIFLGARHTPAPEIVIWLLRWLAFRIMFGAGMIKIRGDECWRDLTCLVYHYETQPMPNGLSWFFHQMPVWAHKGGVLFNHFVELVVPFGLFGPRPLRIAAGVITILFQLILIFSGNLSWLNCITIVICLACFDDEFFRALGLGFDKWLSAVEITGGLPAPVFWLLAIVIGLLSVRPAMNLVARNQTMNGSFDPLHLVNTYGAFGSVGQTRDELIIEGTSDDVVTNETRWLPYEFKGKPGDPLRRPPQVTPYHYKLDWQMWFAAMSPYYNHPWLVNLLGKFLQNESTVMSLVRENPFPEKPPQFVRVRVFRYRFSDWGDEAWWKREEKGLYLPPLSLRDPQFRQILIDQGWLSP